MTTPPALRPEPFPGPLLGQECPALVLLTEKSNTGAGHAISNPMKTPNTIPVSTLRSMLNYDPVTGCFTWRQHRSNAIPAGSPAGNQSVHGYIRIRINGKAVMAARAAWAYVHGCWPDPSAEVDHLNCKRDDNRISNLRLGGRSENSCNTGIRKANTSGAKGVLWRKDRSSWFARIVKNGKPHHLGTFKSKESAAAARKEAADQLHKEFARSH